jgi:hypothetical protein
MEAEFDKEMDALLRRAASRGVLVGDKPKEHLDADTIAAFAENALPANSRTIYTQHLAECDPCRMSLANLISMNAAAEPAMAAAAAPVPAVSAPWYRKLFLAPNLAYLMGGFVLLFGGMLGVFVLQRSYSGDATTLSKVEEPSAVQNAPARAEGGNSLYAANTGSNAATNSPGEVPRGIGVADLPMAESNTATAAPAAPPPAVASSSDSVASAAPAKDQPSDLLDKDKVAAGQPVVKEAPKREEDEKAKNEVKLAAAEQEARKQDANQTNLFRNQQQNQMTPGAGNSKAIGPSRSDIQRDNRAYDDGTTDSKARSLKKTEKPAAASTEGYASARKTVSGKSFELKQGAWYDTSYSGQKTKNVRRSSNDFGKLDGGLQNIANNLSGTIVVVWNGKAYRIQ